VPNTYVITPSDIAAELPSLYQNGFSATTTPTADLVQSLITGADSIVSFRLTANTGQAPTSSDPTASLAERYIIETVKAQVIRIAYVGREAAYVAAIAGPYDALAKGYLDALAGVSPPLAGPRWGTGVVVRAS
jgi:hypothetical protein